VEEATSPQPEPTAAAPKPPPLKPISFARGVPAPECLATEELADCAEAVLRGADAKTILSYSSGAGYAPLREYIGQWFGVHPGRVLLTNGSLQGLAIVSQWLGRGQRVVVEEPTYDRAIKVFLDGGAAIATAYMDDEGLTPAGLEGAIRGADAAFLYTIPTFQNPSGRTMGLERRSHIVQLAQSANLRVIEDDPYGLIRFEGEPVPALFDLSGKTFIYSSSFSKTISPGLRVGWFILPEELADDIIEQATATYITPVQLGQAIAFEFIRRGNFQSNLERVNGLLKARRDAMLAALEKHLPDCRWTRPQGGYFVWLEFPQGVVAAKVLERANGVTFVPGPDFGGLPTAARLAFSFVSPEEIELGVERIAAALEAE
jgi:DNA-binding transcriptional MocR family regulator